MKITTLIKQLQEAKKKHGNIDVLFNTESINGTVNDVLADSLTAELESFKSKKLKEVIDDYRFDIDRGDGAPISTIELGDIDIVYDEKKDDLVPYLPIKVTYFEFSSENIAELL